MTRKKTTHEDAREDNEAACVLEVVLDMREQHFFAEVGG